MHSTKKTLLYIIVAFAIGFGTAIQPSVYTMLVEKGVVEKADIGSNATVVQADDLPFNTLPLIEAYQTIKAKHVDFDDISKKRDVFSFGAAKGLVQALDDPYTAYLDPKESKSFKESLNGDLEGIGAEITIKNKRLTVVSPLKNSPAEKAGILPGDYVYKIEDEFTEGLSLTEAVMKIRGEKGTDVMLTIYRQDGDGPEEVTITRDKIHLDSVTYEMLDNNIMHVNINQFSNDTLGEFEKVIKEVLVKKPKGIILDLRFNGGGYLDSAIDLLSELLDGKKKVVVTKGKIAASNRSIFTSGSGRLANIPLVVLVNLGSASASEIVAGAIQDYKRGLIIGEKTFGKGSVQEVVELKDKSSLRVTVAKWFTPNGQNVDKDGIVPDRIIKRTAEDFKEDKDPQLDEAVNYLKTLR